MKVDRIPRVKRRNHFTIIARILESALHGTCKTRIMYEVNLSYTQLESYLPLLIKLSLLEKSVHEGVASYKTTDKGLSFLEKFKELDEILRS